MRPMSKMDSWNYDTAAGFVASQYTLNAKQILYRVYFAVQRVDERWAERSARYERFSRIRHPDGDPQLKKMRSVHPDDSIHCADLSRSTNPARGIAKKIVENFNLGESVESTRRKRILFGRSRLAWFPCL